MPEIPSAPYELLRAWFRVADWCAYELMKSGEEGVVLGPLAAYAPAGLLIVRAACSSTLYRHRKVGACLAGWLDGPESLLRELFEAERSRDRELPVEDSRRLECQSVVEDIVFSAARWARRDDTRAAALEVLGFLVQRTLDGEYWNTAAYALTTLCRYRPVASRPLLAAFQSYASGTPPAHPCNPTLQQERDFARELVGGNDATLAAVDNVLAEKDAMQCDVDEESGVALRELCRAAEEYGLRSSR